MFPEVAIGLTLVVIVALVLIFVSRMKVTSKRVPMMTNRIAFPGGLRLHEPALALERLDEPEEIVIPFDKATLVIAYPLSTPASVEIEASIPQGFTRAALVRTICEEYAAVYEGEAGSSAIEPELSEQRKRNRTDGAYGIWGYDLQDLVLTAIRWTRKPDGKIQIDLHVESWGLRLTT